MEGYGVLWLANAGKAGELSAEGAAGTLCLWYLRQSRKQDGCHREEKGRDQL